MGKTFQDYFDNTKLYVCRHCRSHISSHAYLISKTFHGKFGRAFLINNVLNVNFGVAVHTMLMTGLHVVRDMHCENCSAEVGWKYDKAYQASQKYKEGKFIMERNQVEKDEWY